MKYAALPCVGTVNYHEPYINVPENHVYKILRDGVSEAGGFVGWMELDDAKQKFGDIFVSGTSRHCPLCTDLHFVYRDKILQGRMDVEDVMRMHPSIVGDKIEEYKSNPLSE